MKVLKQAGFEIDRNPPSITELFQYNAHSIDEQDEINLKTEEDEINLPFQSSDCQIMEDNILKKQYSVQIEKRKSKFSRIDFITRVSCISFDCFNPPSNNNSTCELSRSPSPLKMSKIGGLSPEVKRKSSRGSLKISIPIRKQSISNSQRKTYQDKYMSLEKIGQGSQGEVRRCKSVHSQKEYAVKIIGFRDGEHLLNISREFYLLQSLKHPNIIKTYDFYIENKKCYIILDYVVGFSLQEFLSKNQKMSEEQSKFVIMETIKAVQYLHQKGVCHRDITNNNILIDENKNIIKLIDFSNSKSCEFSRRMMTKTVTLSFMAPEIFSEQEYDKQVDLWSIGVVMYQLLTGCLPFYSESELGLIQDIQKKDLDITSNNPILTHVSSSGIDFLNLLLQKNPKTRMTTSESLCHPWLKQVNLMCSFQKSNKRGSNFSSKSMTSSNQNLFKKENTQQFVRDSLILQSLRQSNEIYSETQQNICSDASTQLDNFQKITYSHLNLDIPTAIENIDSSPFDELYSCQNYSEEIENIKTECTSQFSPCIIPISSISQQNIIYNHTKKNSILKNSPFLLPQTNLTLEKFLNNNDTNFNSKEISENILDDIRSRSRSSIYYSQLQS